MSSIVVTFIRCAIRLADVVSTNRWTCFLFRRQISFPDTASAVHAVHQGRAWGYYGFGANYTRCLMDRFKANVSIATINCSEIQLAMDNSNEQISIIIEEVGGRGVFRLLLPVH